MEKRQAGTSLDSMISSFNTRILELQQLVIARNMYPANSVIELSSIDTAVSAVERQVQEIKGRLHEETEAIPKAKKLIEESLRQQKKLQKMSTYAPSHVPQTGLALNSEQTKCLIPEDPKQIMGSAALNVEEPPAAPLPTKDKRGRASPPLWYITADELDSLSSSKHCKWQLYEGRLTLEKVNMAINDMASYAEVNSQLISAPKKRLAEDLWEKALELRDIAMAEAVKGKYFFLEIDIKGPALKLDNTGKAILTVLHHLGRLSESRIGHHRVIILQRPQ